MGKAEREESVVLSPSKAQGLEALWGVAEAGIWCPWGHVAMDKLVRKRAHAQDDSLILWAHAQDDSPFFSGRMLRITPLLLWAHAQDDSPSSSSVFHPSSSMLDGTLHIQGRTSILMLSHVAVISGNAQKCMLLMC